MRAQAARRYANAFLENAIETDNLEKAYEDMIMVGNTIKASKELRLFLNSPIVKQDQKKAALKTIFENKIDKISFNLINLLLEKQREDLLGDIAQDFVALYNKHHGIIEVDVTSSVTLTDKQVNSLRKQLESTTGKKVKINAFVKEDLIGGLMVRIDDTVIDGTVKFKLGQLKEKFTSVAVE